MTLPSTSPRHDTSSGSHRIVEVIGGKVVLVIGGKVVLVIGESLLASR